MKLFMWNRWKLSGLEAFITEVGRKEAERENFSTKKQNFPNRKWKNAFSIAEGGNGLKKALSQVLQDASILRGSFVLYITEKQALFTIPT